MASMFTKRNTLFLTLIFVSSFILRHASKKQHNLTSSHSCNSTLHCSLSRYRAFGRLTMKTWNKPERHKGFISCLARKQQISLANLCVMKFLVFRKCDSKLVVVDVSSSQRRHFLCACQRCSNLFPQAKKIHHDNECGGIVEVAVQLTKLVVYTSCHF